jgi:hypothetical protein
MDKITLNIDIEKHINCERCRLIIDNNPHESTCCGNLFCSECSKNLVKCKKCKSTCIFRENSFIKRVVSQMTLSCAFKCGMVFPFTELREHMKKCEFREYICNICYEGMKVFAGPKKELLIHMLCEHETYLLEMNDKFPMINESQSTAPTRMRNKAIERLLEEVKGDLRDPYYINSNLGVNDYPSSEEEEYST